MARPGSAGRGAFPGLTPRCLRICSGLCSVDAAGRKLSSQLLSELKVLARTPNLLVACNYGGTISADDGTSKVPLPLGSASIALRALASLPSTHAAVISGRSLRDLASVSRLPAEVHLVGSYGAEFDMDFLDDQPPTTTPILQEVTDALAEAVSAEKDFRIERIQRKPAGVSVRLVGKPQDLAARVRAKAEQIARDRGMYFIVDGTVLDLSLVEPGKGRAPYVQPNAMVGSLIRSGAPRPRPSAPKSSSRAGTRKQRRTRWPMTAPTWTQQSCTSASPDCLT